jgi:hypothetical protein
LAPLAGGLVDLGNGSMTIATGLGRNDMLLALRTGRGDGSWTGSAGITSSAAAASGGSRTVGWLDNGDGTVMVAFAAAGDTNLDWKVDVLDFANIVAGGMFNTGSPATWHDGDFNYDGVVDTLDIAELMANGNSSLASYNGDVPATAAAAVPEPSVACIMTAAMFLAGTARFLRHAPRLRD